MSPSPAADTLLTLALMRQGHWWHLDPPPPPFWQDLQRALRSHPSALLPSPLPHGVIGRPAPLPPLPFHRNALARLCRSSPSDPARHRLAYHADWLLSLLSPDPGLSPHTTSAPPGGPLVSVLIPVFNRADTIAEAVASCLAQTYPHLEVLVIDDASTEDIAAALQPFLPRIRLLRQHPNRGAGAARNLAITQARGSLLHFLDADDLLEPDAIARKIGALHAIPDADLVFSGARQTGLGQHERNERLRFLEPPTGGEDCPTTDLLAVMGRRYPFLTSTVLLPRHLLLETGPFDPALRRHQDTELFFRLALRGIKAIGIDGLPTHRRVTERSLSASPPPDHCTARFRARCLVNLAATPQHWELHGPKGIEAVLQADLFEALALENGADLPQCRRALVGALRRLRTSGPEHAPAAAFLLGHLGRGLARLKEQSEELAATRLYRELAALQDP